MKYVIARSRKATKQSRWSLSPCNSMSLVLWLGCGQAETARLPRPLGGLAMTNPPTRAMSLPGHVLASRPPCTCGVRRDPRPCAGAGSARRDVPLPRYRSRAESESPLAGRTCTAAQGSRGTCGPVRNVPTLTRTTFRTRLSHRSAPRDPNRHVVRGQRHSSVSTSLSECGGLPPQLPRHQQNR